MFYSNFIHRYFPLLGNRERINQEHRKDDKTVPSPQKDATFGNHEST